MNPKIVLLIEKHYYLSYFFNFFNNFWILTIDPEEIKHESKINGNAHKPTHPNFKSTLPQKIMIGSNKNNCFKRLNHFAVRLGYAVSTPEFHLCLFTFNHLLVHGYFHHTINIMK